MSADQTIRDVLKRYDVPYEGNVWQVQSARVIKHAALEQVAASAGIRFDLPTILRNERDEAVMLVAGTLGDVREWSIGEALVNVNYRVSGKQAAYVYAMAEKRAKDRVILKLVQLHGLAYSEDEADDFKQGGQDKAQATARPPAMSVDHMLHEIAECPDEAALAALKADHTFRLGYKEADELSQQRIKQALAKAAEECAA
ncbi:hypothetical protein J2X36_002113 [Methylobacterium sp. BE186]|uniref:hypothetical protein n=1 Tax=Methylobacterium sp. BE186 TaxID=2817715 RepID=UPI00285605C1|nr:hypothetical protein [Methylobacterium sp. BE186]MDR7037366.1 hypothetical protein [Methylobacterium sp. BE186]